ncbi:MAG: MBL fold metallo-hydrolase [Paenibacillaceae bacterium]|nr:MBL fold metallo-hydrolase [Paenibacillaceae bacterium]
MASDNSVAGAVSRVTPDILQVKVPLPFPLRWVNSYLVRGSGGYTLIDPGLHTEEAVRVWEQSLAHANIAYAEIAQIVLTHHHPDHYGLTGLFQQRTGAPVRLSRVGLEQAQRLWGPGQPLTDAIVRLFIRHGIAEEPLRQLKPHLDSFVPLVSPQPEIQPIEAGETLRIGDRSCVAIETAGHAAGHMCLYDEAAQLMFCGDHVLPQISPNVSYIPGVDDNPLASFLSSLADIAAYPVQLALPGHREPFRAFAERARELIRHHDERLERMRVALLTPMTCYELCIAIFSAKLPIHQLRFALSETIAHVLYLLQSGQVTEEECDGKLIYRSNVMSGF